MFEEGDAYERIWIGGEEEGEATPPHRGGRVEKTISLSGRCCSLSKGNVEVESTTVERTSRSKCFLIVVEFRRTEDEM